MNPKSNRVNFATGVQIPHGGRFGLGSPVRLVFQSHAPGERPPSVCPFAAVLGRSNVGKSSLLNALLCTPAARVSQTPGRTQALFWYRIAESFDLVDCPGYGFAKTARALRDKLSELIEDVLTLPPRPCMALLLVDGRLPPQESDLSMAMFLKKEQIPAIVVFTKWDAVKASARVRQLRTLTDAYGADGWPVHAISAETGENLKALVSSVRALLMVPHSSAGN